MDDIIQTVKATFYELEYVTDWKVKITKENAINLSFNNRNIYSTTPPQMGKVNNVDIYFKINNNIFSIKTDCITPELLKDMVKDYKSIKIDNPSSNNSNHFFHIEIFESNLSRKRCNTNAMLTQKEALGDIKKLIMHLYDLLQTHEEFSENLKNIYISFSWNTDTECIINKQGNYLEQEKSRIELLIKLYTLSDIYTYVYNFKLLPTLGQLTQIVEDIKAENFIKKSDEAVIKDKHKYVCVLSPRAVNYILKNILLEMVDAKNIVNNNSFLKVEDIGKKEIGKISIIDDPTLTEGRNSYYFDNEGVIAKRKHIFKEGIFLEPLLNFEMSELLKTEYNIQISAKGNVDEDNSLQFSNMILTGTDKTIEELTEKMQEFVYINELFGFDINQLDGTFLLTSRQGYLVKKQEKQGLSEVIISGNIIDILDNNKTIYSKEYPIENNFIPAIITTQLQLNIL
jgi:predicted Zn-dependent protease